MHIINEVRPTKPTQPNTNRVKVAVKPTTDKPQVRHAHRILKAREDAATQPAIAAAIHAEKRAQAIAAAQDAVNEAEADLLHFVTDDFEAKAIADQKVVVAAAREALDKAEAAS